MNFLSIIVGAIFVIIVYFGFCQKGFLAGYVLNFIYCLASFWLGNQNPEITMITLAKMFLVSAIITTLEYVACRKSQSFLGYLTYIVVIVVAIIIVIYLTKLLFTFLGNPSMLYE